VNTNKPSQKKNKLSKQNGASSCWHAAPIPQDHMRRSVIKDQGDALGAPKRPMSSSSWRVLKYVHHGTGFFVTSYHAGQPENLNGFQFFFVRFLSSRHIPLNVFFLLQIGFRERDAKFAKANKYQRRFFADSTWILGGTPFGRTDGTLGRFDRS
jgi:hypothetical protein